MATNSRNETQLQNPTFIFKGTVRKVRGATMRRMPVDKQTIVVMVDQVLEAPANLAKFGGSEITVQLTGRQKAKVGDELIFHTRGWIFGESIAVHCDKLEEVKRSHAALLSRGGDPVEHRKNRIMRERFDQASAVVSGRVS